MFFFGCCWVIEKENGKEDNFLVLVLLLLIIILYFINDYKSFYLSFFFFPLSNLSVNEGINSGEFRKKSADPLPFSLPYPTKIIDLLFILLFPSTFPLYQTEPIWSPGK